MRETFLLLHTGDMHGRLTPEAAARIRAEREREENTLLVDAGDALRAGNLGVTPGVEPALVLMGQAGYDLMAAGNRETHLWSWALRAKLRGAAWPVLCANVSGPGVAEGNGAAVSLADLRASVPAGALYLRHVTVRLPNGIRVALFGLTVPMVTAAMAARHVSHYVFANPVETARALVPALSAGADAVVAVTHLGLARDRELAAQVPGIHLVVGGHTHDLLPEPAAVNGATLVHAGSYGGHLGRAEVLVEEGHVSVKWQAIPLREEHGGPPRPR